VDRPFFNATARIFSKSYKAQIELFLIQVAINTSYPTLKRDIRRPRAADISLQRFLRGRGRAKNVEIILLAT
jgi:hypothetical protein